MNFFSKKWLTVALMVFLVAFTGCDNLSENSSNTPDVPEKKEMGFVIQLPGKTDRSLYWSQDDVTDYSLKLKKDGGLIDSAKGAPGESVRFIVSEEGEYTIAVYAYCEEVLIAEGSSDASVRNGDGFVTVDVYLVPKAKGTALDIAIHWQPPEGQQESNNGEETPVECVVTFDCAGGSPALESAVVKSGEFLPIPETIIVKNGYDFEGWYNGDVKVDSSIKVEKSITLTAHFTVHEYTITYAEIDGATNPNTVTKYTIESDDITLQNAKKAGNTFSGWKSGSEFVTKIAKGTTGDITLTAVWDSIKLRVKFDAANGTDVSETEIEYGGTVTKPSDPKKDVDDTTIYTFSGWYTSTDGGTTFSEQAFDFTTSIKQDITLYAKWMKTARTYTVMLNANGGTIVEGKDVTSYTCGTVSRLPESNEIISRPDYDFDGWFISTDNGATFTGEAVSSISVADFGNKIFYAKWIPHPYTINYMLDDGTNALSNPTTYTVETNPIILQDAEKYGNIFVGWKNGNDFITKIAKGTTGDITLTAVWEPIPVTSVMLNKTELKLIAGETEYLAIGVYPKNTYAKNVTWTTSNANIATVVDGVVTAVARGTATITVTADGISAACTLTVKAAISVGDIISFGAWPQTIKSEDITITNETKVVGMFTYYKGSDDEWYAKSSENSQKYNCKYSDGTIVGQGGTGEKYFKVEPINWRVLTDNYSGKKLLLAESILVNKRFDDKSNNYEDSEIRSWLNGYFLNTAFSDGEQSDISIIRIDNSSLSTNPDEDATLWENGENQYACDNTEDKIFLLSVQEVTTASYGFDTDPYACKGDGIHEGSSRIRITTDFAKASGAWQSTETGYGGWWWLRSPYYNEDNYVRHVYIDGVAAREGSAVYTEEGGVVPALCLED